MSGNRFNAHLNEVICVHPGANLCKAGHCWWLRKALYGTRMASQMWGETVRAVMDSGGWHCLHSVPNAYCFPFDGLHEDGSSSVCHGDDFLAEGSERTLSELDRLLSEHFEVTAGNMIGPERPGQTRYLKRIIGYTEDLPEHCGPGFFWTADPKHVDFLVQRTKRGGQPAVTPGTKATGMGGETHWNYCHGLGLVRLREQEELRCTCGLTGETRCLPARQQCNMFPNQTS